MASRDDPYVHAFGRRLAACRQRRGISQADLAEKLGLESAETVSRYERGEREPRLSSLRRLAEVLSVDVVALLPRSSPPGDPESLELQALADEAVALVNALGVERIASARTCVHALRGVVVGCNEAESGQE